MLWLKRNLGKIAHDCILSLSAAAVRWLVARSPPWSLRRCPQDTVLRIHHKTTWNEGLEGPLAQYGQVYGLVQMGIGDLQGKRVCKEAGARLFGARCQDKRQRAQTGSQEVCAMQCWNPVSQLRDLEVTTPDPKYPMAARSKVPQLFKLPHPTAMFQHTSACI